MTLIDEPAFPVKVSDNGRYFVDQNDRPVFWLGTTQWQIFRDNTLEEARTILASAKDRGFAFIQAMLAGVGDGTKPNVYGERPWLDDNPLTPNAAYFDHVDAVIQSARDLNLVVSLTVYHQLWRKIITRENARGWATWLAQRYQLAPNLVWSMNPEEREEFIPVVRELAAGLQDGDGGRHLISFMPDPSPYSSSYLHPESWLDFNAIQTWKSVALIYPMVTDDYNLSPVKPVLMGEGAYEAGTEYGFDVTPLWVRRQAYYSFLLGAHHAYGHNDIWRMLPTWPQALDADGAVQMGVLKQVFQERYEWWNLVPDQDILAEGGRTTGTILHLAARHVEGRWIMAYLGEPASIAADLTKIAGADRCSAFWIDPRTGNPFPIGQFSAGGLQRFTTPDGWEDAMLVVEATQAKF